MTSEPAEYEYLTQAFYAHARPILEKRTVKHKVGTRMVERKKGMFSRETEMIEEDVLENKDEWVPTGKYYDHEIDIIDLATRMEKDMNACAKEGWEVFSNDLTIKGFFDARTIQSVTQGLTGGWAWGYSLTSGVILTYRRRKKAKG